MDEKYIGPGGRFFIFSGVPTFGVAVLVCIQEPLIRAVGLKASICIGLGMVMAFYSISMFLSNYIPKRFIIPLGIIGWILTLSLLYWFFCFGPGAFGHDIN